MDQPIISRDAIRAKARRAFKRGAGREDHGMNEGSPAIADWQDEWDQCEVARLEQQQDREWATDQLAQALGRAAA
jgi:hypothetical protein